MPNGDKQEEYYMQTLVLNVPLRKDTPMLSTDNKSGTYMEECAIRGLLSGDDALNALHNARELGFSLTKLRHMAQSLKNMQWIGEDEFNLFIEEVETVHNANCEDKTEVLDADEDVENADLGNLAMNSNRFDLDEFYSTLSPSQQKAYDYITQSLATGQQVLTAIIGEAGTGNSYLRKGVVEHAVTVLHLTARKFVTTGVAAHFIGGETLHHVFQMDIHCKSRLESGTIEYDIISNTDVIVIDEFSLLEMRPFLTMDNILREIACTAEQQHKPFGGKHIILMGDPAHLPSIDQEIFDTHLWRKFDIVILKDVKRQEDETCQNILSTVRMGETNDEINSILRARLLPPDIDYTKDATIDDAGAAISCSLRRERDVWNKRFLERIDAESHTFEAEDSDVTGNPLPEKDKHRSKWVHQERLEDSLTLKVSARVVLCRNIDMEHGWLNGTIAIVKSIHNKCITIEKIKTGRRTGIIRMRQSLSFPGSSIQYFHTQVPLILGWALTEQKVQGMTLDRAYILLNRSFFASGLAYVALSRVKSLDKLHLIEYDPTALCLDTYYKSLLDWMKSVNRIGEVESVYEGSVPQSDYPSRPKELTRSVCGRTNESLQRKSSTDTIQNENSKKTSISKGPTNQNTKLLDSVESEKPVNTNKIDGPAPPPVRS